MNPAPDALRLALAGMLALTVTMGIGRFAFTPMLPMMQADAGLTVAQGGWLASANYLGYLVGALSALALRAQPAQVIRGGLAAIALLTAGMGLGEQFALWMGLRFAAGVASAWVLVFVSVACLERLAMLGRPALGGLLFSGVGAGMAIAGLVCLAAMQSGLRSDTTWLLLGAAAALQSLLPWFCFVPDPRAAATGTPVTRAAPMRWDRNALLLVAAYGLYGFGYIIPATFVPAMAREIVQDPAVFGWSWPLFGAAAAVSTLVAAALIRVFGNRRVWLACTLVLALGVAAPAAQPGLAAILLSAVCVGATFVVITLTALQEARRTAGEGARALMVALTAAFAAGQILGPLTVSGLSPSSLATSGDGAALAGLQGPLWLAAALLLVSAVMLAVPVRQNALRG